MTRRQLILVALSYGVLALSAWVLVVNLTLRSDLSFVFPRDADADMQLLADRLQSGPTAGLLLMAVSGGDMEERIEVGTALAENLVTSGKFDFVANGRLGAQEATLQALFKKRYLMNPAVTAEDFTAGALQQALEARLANLGSAEGGASQSLLPRDPTDRLRQIADDWSGQRQRAAGLWLSRDGARALIMASTSASAFDLATQTKTLAFIEEEFETLRGNRPLDLTMTGPAVFASANSQLIRGEMEKLTIASALLVVTILLVVFRSPALVALLLLPLGFGVLAGAAAVQVAFGEIHGITLAFGGTLIGVAVDYPIHLASHSAATGDTHRAMRKIWATLRLGLLTTLVGFLPLTFSSFPGLSQLGVFEIVGLTTAALVTRYLLPSLLPPIRASTRRPSQPNQKAGRPTWVSCLRSAVLALAVAALGFLIWQTSNLWETDLHKLSTTTAESRALDQELRQELGAADVRYVLILRGPGMEEVLRGSERLAEDLAPLVEKGVLAGFDMAAHYLPSQDQQSRRREALPDRPEIENNLAQATAGLPFRPGTFEPFLEDLAAAKDGQLLTLEDFEAAGLAWRLAPLLFEQGDDWVALLVPRGLTNPEAVAQFVAKRQAEDLSFMDLKAGSEALMADYRQEALLWLALGAVIASGILWLGLRDWRRLGRVTLPISLSLLFTVAALVALAIPLSLFHLLSLLLVAGVGLDYTLFFERHGARGGEAAPTLRASLVCAGTTVSVFTILALSPIPVLRGIGLTVALGAAIALAMAYLFADRSQRKDS